MEFRLIVLKERDGFTQMAIDEAILNSVEKGDAPETLRYFDFLPPAITIGRLQRIDDINTNLCKGMKVDVVRRLTGGRAVIHSGDFTFSLIIRKNNPIFGGDVNETYKAISYPFLSLLRSLGMPAAWTRLKPNHKHEPLCFSSVTKYELTIGLKKVLGIAQYRKSNTVLAQGTLLLKRPPDSFVRLITAPVSTNNLFYIDEEKVTFNFEKFAILLKQEIEKFYRIKIGYGNLSNAEMKMAKLLKERYKSHEWNFAIFTPNE